MNCLECQELLQRRLDGEAIGGEGLDRHLAECAECREAHHAAVRLLDGLKSLPRPALPANLSSRIGARVLAEQRGRRIRWRIGYVVSAAAAAMLLAYFSGVFTPTMPGGPKPHANLNPAPVPQPQPLPEAPLAKSAEGARNAVASLTEKLTSGTQKQAQLFLAAATPAGLEMPPMPAVPGISDPLDPAADSLKQASQTVAQGLEPVAKTARRAWNYFVRELPTIR